MSSGPTTASPSDVHPATWKLSSARVCDQRLPAGEWRRPGEQRAARSAVERSKFRYVAQATTERQLKEARVEQVVAARCHAGMRHCQPAGGTTSAELAAPGRHQGSVRSHVRVTAFTVGAKRRALCTIVRLLALAFVSRSQVGVAARAHAMFTLSEGFQGRRSPWLAS